jgi:hypothetical protein
MNKSLCLLAIAIVAILTVNLAGAAPGPPKKENARDYIKIEGVPAGPGYPWKNWWATNTHRERAIRFTIHFTGPAEPDKSYDGEPGERKWLGSTSYTPTLAGARFISH